MCRHFFAHSSVTNDFSPLPSALQVCCVRFDTLRHSSFTMNVMSALTGEQPACNMRSEFAGLHLVQWRSLVVCHVLPFCRAEADERPQDLVGLLHVFGSISFTDVAGYHSEC